MKKFQFVMIIYFLFGSSMVFGDEQILETYTDDSILQYDQSLIFTFGYKNGVANIDHKEQSSSSGFVSLNQETKISKNSLEIGIIKEFLNKQTFSFSAIANFGFEKGQDQGEAQNNTYEFTDKVSGSFYSLGGSLNYNREAFMLKVQPFVYLSMTRANSKYLLNYSKKTGPENSTSIQYDNELQQTNTGVGLRFIDPEVKLMSYFKVNYSLNSSSQSNATSSTNLGEIALSNQSSVAYRPISISLGFGFFF